MSKTIKARCVKDVYAGDIRLFMRGNVYTFEVQEFKSVRPDYAEPEKDFDGSWDRFMPKEDILCYETKKGHFSFRFFEHAYAGWRDNVLPFDDFFEQLYMKLTLENVERIFKECLAEERTSDEVVPVDGVMNGFVLKKDKLKFYREEIKGMLDILPDDFREHGGGGWSFLNLCVRKDGEQWTGSHAVMEHLVCLGIGSGKMKYLLPRQMWKVLPGGMPYVAIMDE